MRVPSIITFTITVLVNDAEKSSDIDSQEAQQTLEVAEANLKISQPSPCAYMDANLAASTSAVGGK